MERKDVFHKVQLEFLYIVPRALSAQKLTPCLKQVFDGDDILILVPEHDPTKTHINRELLPLLQKIKAAYLIWFAYYQELPKLHRYTIGARIDALWVEVMEATAEAAFLARSEKQPYVRLAIRKMETLRLLLMVLWEAKSLNDKKYIALSEKADEIGRMLGGWSGQLQQQNSPR
jgi:hypothetical protein